MHSISYTIAIVIAVVLIHVSYVDFRFRYREGLLWFWLMRPAPPIMWVARATAIGAVIAACTFPWLRYDGPAYFWLLGCVMGVHIITLILLEFLEPR